MARADQIPSDLTLEITENLSPDRFIEAVRAFFGYIKEISASVTQEDPDWIVRVKEGSQLIGVDPRANFPRPILQKIHARARIGINALVLGNLDDAQLTDSALKNLQKLSEISLKSKSAGLPIRLWVEKKPIEIKKEIATLIEKDWRIEYRDAGTLDGRLEAIQDKSGLSFSVRDPVFSQAIRCFFPEALLPKALTAFRKRVEVSGIIHYRKNGKPVRIDVADIELLPDDADLPSLADVRGILRQSA